jgi:hypothetical protein
MMLLIVTLPAVSPWLMLVAGVVLVVGGVVVFVGGRGNGRE